ncbi:MAG: hypothetical protein JST54_24455 [Deltaproteobacteria bacterium]|nr:hypothetical protein [Deltaproteobacteria bacterium]
MKTTLVLSAALAAMLTGCGDQCDPKTFAARCDGNKAVTCPEPGVDQVVPNHSTTVDCGSGACVMSGGTAFCALSSTADPACDGGSGNACESNTNEVFCELGFATAHFPCLSCGPDDAGATNCHGGPSSTCSVAADCAPGLHCTSTGFCEGGGDGG